ncbi:MAG: long-chain-fatty-acid--CoA ligase [Deltaproteobacteria bacterium]|nr:long-chain-fatty-acid--CoA ligase [Deltaproteobacteria bacterium]
MRSMRDSIRWCAAVHGEKIAIVDGDRRVTYQQLYRRVNRLANAFLDMGLKEGDRCSVLLSNCSEYIEIYLALASTGIAAVPLNFRLVGTELAYIINNSDSKALILGSQFLEEVKGIIDKLEHISSDRIILVGGEGHSGMKEYEEVLAESSDKEIDLDIDLNGCFFQGYTAGTTGLPKGCVNSHAGFVEHHKRMLIIMKVNTNDIQLVPAPLFHEAPTLFSLMQIFMGGTLVITGNPTPEEILSLIQQEKVTNVFMVPTMYQTLVEFPERNSYDVSSVRAVISGGAPMLKEIKASVIEYFKTAGLNEFYGATEMGLVANLYPHEQKDRPRSVGKPVPGWEVKLLDDNGQEVPVGSAGEIYMKGPRLLKEYYKLPEVTATATRGDYFTLNDVGKFDEQGYLFIVDRVNDMIISGGENIYPIEIEEVIAQHSAVRQVVVIGIPDQKWGQSVKAVVVLKEGQTASDEEIRQFCTGKLAGYKIPKSVDFRESMPLSTFGKILKREVRDEYWKNSDRKF